MWAFVVFLCLCVIQTVVLFDAETGQDDTALQLAASVPDMMEDANILSTIHKG